MTDDKPSGDQHVGEMLSGYIDGELTQQARQRVRLHCETCATCRKELETLTDMRERIGNATLTDRDQNTWR